MQTLANDKDPEQSPHTDTKPRIDERPVSKKLDKIADEAAGRGRARQQRDEAGKDIIVDSDGHGSVDTSGRE